MTSLNHPYLAGLWWRHNSWWHFGGWRHWNVEGLTFFFPFLGFLFYFLFLFFILLPFLGVMTSSWRYPPPPRRKYDHVIFSFFWKMKKKRKEKKKEKRNLEKKRLTVGIFGIFPFFFRLPLQFCIRRVNLQPGDKNRICPCPFPYPCLPYPWRARLRPIW